METRPRRPARPAAAAPPPPPADRPRPAITPSMAAVGVALAVLFLGVGRPDRPLGLERRAGGREADGRPRGRHRRRPSVGRHRAAGVQHHREERLAGGQGGLDGPAPAAAEGRRRRRSPPPRTPRRPRARRTWARSTPTRSSRLPPGNYIVYSGQYDSKAKATDALSKLKKDFPKREGDPRRRAPPRPSRAPRPQADKQAVQNLDNLSGSDYAKQSRKLPDTLALPGKPPPKDNKQGGGGTGFETIN